MSASVCGATFGHMPPRAIRGEMRQALAGSDSLGACSRANARQQGRPIAGEPGSEGTRPNGGLLPDTAEALASGFNRANDLRRGSVGGAQAIDARALSEIVRMMKGGR